MRSFSPNTGNCQVKREALRELYRHLAIVAAIAIVTVPPAVWLVYLLFTGKLS